MLQKSTTRDLFPTFTDRANLPALYLICIVIAYVGVGATLYERHTSDDQFIYAYAFTVLLVLSGARLGYGEATRAFRILVRSIISFALFYILFSHVEITSHLIGNNGLADFELNSAWMIAVACGIAAFFRPSFGLVPLLYIVWQKHALTNIFALHLGWMDFFTLVETGIFLILGYLVFGAFRKFEGFDGSFTMGGSSKDEIAEQSGGTLRTVDVLVLFAIAFHFGNYLYAGLIKAALGGDPTFWVLENHTELLILAALESKVLPISFSPWLTSFTFEMLESVRIWTNFLTIMTQLFAVFAILRIRWAIIITLCYDALHLIIFFTTGIFFWKFIILNLAIVAGLGVMQITRVPRQLGYALSAAVVLSPLVFHIMPSFAWLDSRSTNRMQVFAITEDGTEYSVPSNYFLGMSITFAQNRMIWPTEGAVPTETWGVSRNREIMERGLACDWSKPMTKAHAVPFGVPKAQIAQYLRRHHLQVLSMIDDDGRFEYNMFPHHIFSMPWYARDFEMLDKRRIVAYRYQSEVLCLNYENGEAKPHRTPLGSFEIPL